METHVGDNICILGDFNADPKRETRFGKVLRDFVEESHMPVADQLLVCLTTISVTYRSSDYSSCNVLDRSFVMYNFHVV